MARHPPVIQSLATTSHQEYPQVARGPLGTLLAVLLPIMAGKAIVVLPPSELFLHRGGACHRVGKQSLAGTALALVTPGTSKG